MLKCQIMNGRQKNPPFCTNRMAAALTLIIKKELKLTYERSYKILIKLLSQTFLDSQNI
jgi:hypothetical protein